MASPITLSSPAVDVELFKACRNGDKGSIKKFIKEGRSFNVINSEGITPLMYAAACQSEEVFTKVLAQTSEEFLHKVNKSGENVLFYACRLGALSRVKILFEDKAVKVIRASNGKFPSEKTNNEEIRNLLLSDTVCVIDKDALVFIDAWKKHGDNAQAVAQEFFERTGQYIYKPTLIQDWKKKFGSPQQVEDDKDVKKHKEEVLQHPRTLREIRDILTEQVPNSTTSANKKILEVIGISVPKNETGELLKQVGVTPKKDLLNDKNVRREIGNYFKENRPTSVQEAIDYIYEKYQFTCKPKHIIPFLKYFGIVFDPDSEVD